MKVRCVSAHAAVTQAGCTAPKVRKINQDAMLVIEDWCKGLGAYWFCVLDGHGPSGHHVSSRVKQKLPTLVADAWAKHKDLKVALAQGYRSASEDLRQSTIDILCSGTTCVTCVLHGSTLYFASVGDSRAILGRGSLEDPSPWTAISVTTDHKPELESEKKRILAAGGRIAALQEDGEPCGPLRLASQPPSWLAGWLASYLAAFSQPAYLAVFSQPGYLLLSCVCGSAEPFVTLCLPLLNAPFSAVSFWCLRVWLATEDLPGLAMSRSLGDTLAAQAGVICEPDVGCVSLSPADRLLLIASDGVWETVSNDEALHIVRPFVEKGEPQKGCHALIEKAQRRWLEEDGAVDDITCVLVILKC